MNKFRKIVFWLHLVLGVVGGLVIFIMCVTGAALSFEKNITENIEHDQRFVTSQGRKLPMSGILGKFIAARPDAKPSSLTSQSNPEMAVAIGVGRDGTVYLDPYTGEITGQTNQKARAFFGFMTDLHRYIAVSGDSRPIGKAITGACNLMFLGLAITGLYIWLPRRISWKHLRPNIWFRSAKSGKARDFNWHNTIGFWTPSILIVLTLTATVMSYQWAGNLIYTLTGNELPQQAAQPQNPPSQTPPPLNVPENIDALWSRATSQSDGWKSISLRLPIAKEAVFTIDEAKSLNVFGRSSLSVDAATGEVVKWEPYANQNSARQIRSWVRFTHTGESLGIVGQIMGFFACIGGAVLVYTGLALAVRRLASFIRRRSRVDDSLDAGI